MSIKPTESKVPHVFVIEEHGYKGEVDYNDGMLKDVDSLNGVNNN
jgi:hypothetical protein